MEYNDSQSDVPPCSFPISPAVRLGHLRLEHDVLLIESPGGARFISFCMNITVAHGELYCGYERREVRNFVLDLTVTIPFHLRNLRRKPRILDPPSR